MQTVYIILIILCFFILCQILVRIVRHSKRVPAPPWLGYFLDTGLRRLVQSPYKLIERSGIKLGMKVLDLGCGSGAFTTYAARAVGEQGKVYAVDIQSAMLRQLERKLARPENEDITNVEIKQASAYELPFEDAYLDLVYMVTVLPEIPDRGRALREIRRVLKQGGILAVTELLPDPDYPWRSTTIKMCSREGFVLEENSGNLWNYTLRFRKPVTIQANTHLRK